jgi:hypothetical protein
MFAVVRDVGSLGELWLPWVINSHSAGPRQIQVAEIVDSHARHLLENLDNNGSTLLAEIEQLKDSLSHEQNLIRRGPFVVFRTLEGPVLSQGYSWACALYELRPKQFEFEMDVRTPPAGHPLTAAGMRDIAAKEARRSAI